MDKFEDTMEVVEHSIERVENSTEIVENSFNRVEDSIGEALDSTEIVQDSVETINDSMEMADGNHNHVAIQIEAMLAGAQPLFTTECCIYRVPCQIRESNQAAYTPKVVSVGPLHHRANTELLKMEDHKQVYCLKFIERCTSNGVSLDDLVTNVQDLERSVRQCYSDEINFNEEELVKVILVDSGFVIELFWRFYSGELRRDDVIFRTPWLTNGIKEDLLLLENQLPFFILEKLYNLAFPSSLNANHPSFRTLTLDYFKYFTGEDLPSTCSIAHFTDLLRTSHLQPLDKRLERVDKTLDQLYSATELTETGVKLRVNDTSQCILDLQLSGRCLKIPCIKVEDRTEMLLRNMIALEQCHYPDKTYIIDYMQVMDFLINTDKDVDVLVKNGIIVNWLGDSNKVAALFNGLMKNILYGNCNRYYLDIGEKLNAYCNHPLHSKMATLKRDYCNTPWKTVASIAGIALLVLTIIQTVFAILK